MESSDIPVAVVGLGDEVSTLISGGEVAAVPVVVEEVDGLVSAGGDVEFSKLDDGRVVVEVTTSVVASR